MERLSKIEMFVILMIVIFGLLSIAFICHQVINLERKVSVMEKTEKEQSHQRIEETFRKVLKTKRFAKREKLLWDLAMKDFEIDHLKNVMTTMFMYFQPTDPEIDFIKELSGLPYEDRIQALEDMNNIKKERILN